MLTISAMHTSVPHNKYNCHGHRREMANFMNNIGIFEQQYGWDEQA
jgi:hypothetical protein